MTVLNGKINAARGVAKVDTFMDNYQSRDLGLLGYAGEEVVFYRTSLRKQFRRTAPGSAELTEFVELDAAPLPSPADLVPIEVPTGTLVVLHGLLPHWSDVNRSPASRHAYTVHCISGTAEYPAWNWLQRPADMPLRRLDAVAA